MNEIIEQTKAFVREQLHGAESGHDASHALRVHKSACEIAKGGNCNQLVVELAALLHDIADSKFHNGDEEKGSIIATNFLEKNGVSSADIEAIVFIINTISFHKGKAVKMTTELAIVQDADRLDAIGAIGIARAFSYGGYMCRPFYDISIQPNTQESKEHPNSINHFYEKLLLLKDLMNTETGKKIAEQRHAFLEQYLQQFWLEVESK
jgi:uncharacterized protein